MKIDEAFFELSLKMLVVSNSNSMIQYRSMALEFFFFLIFWNQEGPILIPSLSQLRYSLL